MYKNVVILCIILIIIYVLLTGWYMKIISQEPMTELTTPPGTLPPGTLPPGNALWDDLVDRMRIQLQMHFGMNEANLPTSTVPVVPTTLPNLPTVPVIPTTLPNLPTVPVVTTLSPLPTTPLPTTPLPTTPLPTTIPPPKPAFAITGIAGLNTGAGDAYSTYTTNSQTYSVCVLTRVGTSYTVSYTNQNSSLMYVLAVGGGAGGGYADGGGGGAGGVVIRPVTLPAGTNAVNVAVGAGAGGGGSYQAPTSVGGNTTVQFPAATGSNLTAYGGNGPGLGYGPGGNAGGMAVPNSNGNFAYNGGGGAGPGWVGGGGGGAGSPAQYSFSTYGYYAQGGNGIRCLLPPLANYTPPGKSILSSYYWGGGGGSGNNNGQTHPNVDGGLGGGGGGAGSLAGKGGTGGYNPGGGGAYGVGGNAGNGGANTGSGGGGVCLGTTGTGGSGICVLAFPQLVETYLVTNYNFASPAAAANSIILNPSSIAGWTATGTLTSNTPGVAGPYGNFVVANGTNGGYMYPCPYGTFFMCQFYGMANNFTMTSTPIPLLARTYTVTFVAATRGIFTNAHVMTMSLAGGSTSTQSTFTASNTKYPWTPFSFTCTPPAAGNYNMVITWSTSNTTDSMIGISQILVS
jgi:hypothetical protein